MVAGAGREERGGWEGREERGGVGGKERREGTRLCVCVCV